MSLARHPLVERVLRAGRAYGAKEISLEDLQREISAAMSALEGDVPSEVRDAMFQLEAEVDSTRFTISEADRPAEVTRSLRTFTSVLGRGPRDSAAGA